MHYQTESGFSGFINNWGCFLFSILYKVEKKTGYHFSVSDITALYETAMRHGFIQQEVFDPFGKPKDGCDILDKKELYNLACSMFSLKSKCTESRKEDAKYTLKSGEEEILELKRNGYHGSHFVSGNGNSGLPIKSEIEFDPIAGGSNCARSGWIESKRILVIENI